MMALLANSHYPGSMWPPSDLSALMIYACSRPGSGRSEPSSLPAVGRGVARVVMVAGERFQPDAMTFECSRVKLDHCDLGGARRSPTRQRQIILDRDEDLIPAFAVARLARRAPPITKGLDRVPSARRKSPGLVENLSLGSRPSPEDRRREIGWRYRVGDGSAHLVARPVNGPACHSRRRQQHG